MLGLFGLIFIQLTLKQVKDLIIPLKNQKHFLNALLKHLPTKMIIVC